MIQKQSKIIRYPVQRAGNKRIAWIIGVYYWLTADNGEYHIKYDAEPGIWFVNIRARAFEQIPKLINQCCDLLDIPPEYPDNNAHTEAAAQSTKPKRGRRKTKPSESTNPE